MATKECLAGLSVCSRLLARPLFTHGHRQQQVQVHQCHSLHGLGYFIVLGRTVSDRMLDVFCLQHGTLLPDLEPQALKFKMHAVLLTVQKSNLGATAFYAMIGYKQHPSCPERNGFEDFDGVDPGYRILWKDLRR